MKKRYAFLLVLIGIIIGLGISIKFDWLEKINAGGYYVEDLSEPNSSAYKNLSKEFFSAASLLSIISRG